MKLQQVSLDYTGERMVPEKADAITFWEHVYRYRFAAPYAKGRKILDIACGEGYGTASLAAAGASSVIGIDISEEACAHARKRYDVDARVGDAENISLPEDSIDLVVSFETIEHVTNPDRFLDECQRVLVAGGTLVISTPNRIIYSGEEQHNPFHYRELNEQEFMSLLSSRFDEVELYEQCPTTSLWSRSLLASYGQPPGIRGLYRLKMMLRRTLCPHLRPSLWKHYRKFPLKAISMKIRILGRMVDPYFIRKKLAHQEDNPIYFLAVASHPKHSK